MYINLMIASLFTSLAISSPVSQKLNSDNPYQLNSLTYNDPVEDLAFKYEPLEESYNVALPPNELIADCSPDATMNGLLDEEVQKRDLHHQEHVKRQVCPERDPCQGMEGYKHLTCGGNLGLCA